MNDPKIDDLRLPMAVLNRVMKTVLPSGAAVSKDARTYIMRASSVFILYILSQAEEHAMSKKRKTVNVEDVMFVLKANGFDTIYESMNNAFDAYKASRPSKILKTKGPKRDERPSAPNPIERVKDIVLLGQGSDAGDIEDIIN
ncbi:unnamed protein product [Haemonchus placei]|uniref:DNA polymerase epsilon subunit 3 n=1 Tax=Haemonchus placei TaxID=6290 RepID=A0A0N4WEE2_HAEPC|nr:unnamed protein product [Haemonchus placei]